MGGELPAPAPPRLALAHSTELSEACTHGGSSRATGPCPALVPILSHAGSGAGAADSPPKTVPACAAALACSYAVVVMTDVSVYPAGPARPTSGAGAVALLIGG